MKILPPFLLVSCVILTLSVPSVHAAAHIVDCTIDQEPCSITVGTREVIFDILPKPVKLMEEVTFVVSVTGGSDAPSLMLNLSMPAMYMGRNEVVLKKRPDGKYSGAGIIPRCPSGKRLWQAEIGIPGSGSFTYRFNVAF